MIGFGGIEFQPPLPLFLAFALARLALNIVPGADMTFVIAIAADRLRHVTWLGRTARCLAATATAVLALRLAFADRR